MSNSNQKPSYDRVVELLQTVVQNMVCMSTPKRIAMYLSDIGFTDDELRNLVNLKPNDETESDNADDDDNYLSDYPELEPQDDHFDGLPVESSYPTPLHQLFAIRDRLNNSKN